MDDHFKPRHLTITMIGYRMDGTYHTFPIWSMLLLLMIPLWMGCSKAEESTPDCSEVSVRISAMPDGAGDREPGAASRANGSIVSENSAVGNRPGTEKERYVGSLRVLVFDAGTSVLKLNKLFTLNAAAAEDRFTTDGSGVISADFKLLSGRYNFRLVANEQDTWGLASLSAGTATLDDFNALPSAKGIVNTLKSTSNLDTGVAAFRGIPMTGENQFNIPNGTASSASTPYDLPEITLKRSLVKIEVYLTNQDAANGNAVFANASIYKIVSVGLHQMNQVYNLRENDETPVTETLPTDPNARLLNTISHDFGAPFPNREVLSAYMAERKKITNPDAATYLEIKTIRLHEEIAYKIPISTIIAGANDYNLVRNTSYRVECVLNGAEAPDVKITYNVAPWTDAPITLPPFN